MQLHTITRPVVCSIPGMASHHTPSTLSTIPARAELIFKQEKSLREQLRILKKQMEVLKYKKKFYQDLLDNRRPDSCNPLNYISASEPNIAPEE